MRTMSELVIANQIDATVGAALRAHRSAPRVIDCFEEGKSAPWNIPGDAEVLFTRAFSAWAQAPDAGPDLPALKWIQTYSAGVELYPRWLARGRLLSCGRGLTSPQIAEYVLAAILRREKDLDAIRARTPADWRMCEIGCLEGKTLGLLGYGAIGQEIARRALAFGMRVAATRRGEWRAGETGTRDGGIVPCRDAAELIGLSDHFVVAAPLTAATRRIVDAALLAKAKPALHLINVSRGALVDHAALVDALDAGTIAFATLDVTDPEPLPEGHALWRHPRALLTPHISYRGGPEVERFLAKVLHNLDAYLDGQPLLDQVDPSREY
jgi:phosphoglycerate dehydrogenase-like enzyme